MVIIQLAVSFGILLFLAITFSIISRLNNLTLQMKRIEKKLEKTKVEERLLEERIRGQAPKEEES